MGVLPLRLSTGLFWEDLDDRSNLRMGRMESEAETRRGEVR